MSLNIGLRRFTRFPRDLDDIILDLAGFGDVVPEFLHIPGGGGFYFRRIFQYPGFRFW